jgi:hypothetical protein
MTSKPALVAAELINKLGLGNPAPIAIEDLICLSRWYSTRNIT